MFSRRSSFDPRLNQIAQAVARKRAKGVPILDLTESNPTHAGLIPPIEVLDGLSDPEALQYDPTPRGRLAAREAVARDYLRRDVWIDPEHVVLTASTSEAYSFLLKALCDPGDNVLVPRPSYPLFEHLARLESVELRPYALGYDGEWHVSPSAIEARIDDRTRAIVIVNPNNPTGSFLKAEEGRSLLDVSAASAIPIVSDEVFADFWIGDDPRRVATVAGEGPALTFALGGLSKSCGLPQMKLAWIAVSGPEDARREALARLDLIGDTFLSVGTPVQCAAPDILERIRKLQSPIIARIRENHEMLKALVKGRPDVTLLPSEGGWCATLQVPATMPEEERVLMLLETQDVLVHPGYFFDFERESYLVVSLLTRRDWFTVGIDRLLMAV